ncbi:MAG: cobalt ECF transporter T component CbiQ [Halobacteriota archaeon]
MQHDFIDKYSDRDSPVHRIDPRVKVICVLAFVVLATTSMNIYSLVASLAIVGIILAVARVPLTWGYSRALIVVPFAGTFALVKAFTVPGTIIASWGWLTVTTQGLIIAVNLLLRSYVCVLSIVLLTSTTPFSTLLASLERLHVPPLITSMLSFTYRYIFVFVDEGERLERAKTSRCIERATYPLRLRASAKTIGMVFIRAYERGERIYRSMLSRGFEGKINTLDSMQIQKYDIASGLCFVVATVAVIIAFR